MRNKISAFMRLAVCKEYNINGASFQTDRNWGESVQQIYKQEGITANQADSLESVLAAISARICPLVYQGQEFDELPLAGRAYMWLVLKIFLSGLQ